MSPPAARRTARYTVQIDKDALDQLAALPRNVRERLDAKIQALADNPRPPGSKRLTGQDGLYRLRVGDYRAVYTVQDDVLLVIVIRIAHRSRVYQRLPKKARGN